MRTHSKRIEYIGAVLLGLVLSMITNVPLPALAVELSQNGSDRKAIDVDILMLKENLTEGMLEIAEDVRSKIVLYQLIMEGVEQYVSETGIKDVFSCDLERDLLYGDREFFLAEAQRAEWDHYVYPIKSAAGLDMRQENYKLLLQGTEHELYMDVNLKEGKVCVYPKEYGPALQTKSGNSATYALIERDEDNQIVYYPDIYVESDWDDLKRVDNHLGEVSFDELHELHFLKIPEDVTDPERYLNVASALKRYVEEKQIEDVFYFDARQDVICQVTNLIYTCRVRGNTMALYIDIDGYNMKAHVYQVEDSVKENTLHAEEPSAEQGTAVEENADKVNDGYYISGHVQIPTDFTEQILLYGYIEYGIRKYNEANQQTNTYACNLQEDMLPFEMEFCMADRDQEPFKADLAKEIIPELANNIYNFRLKNQNTTIYMSIDTYNMKIYVYDAIAQSTAYGLPLYNDMSQADMNCREEIERYMKEFISMYTTEACGGKQRVFIKSKDIYTDDFGSPVELTIYTNEKEEKIRYKVQTYGETGHSIINYYLCNDFIYVNQQQEYYSSQILAEQYNDILYCQTNAWIIVDDKVYLLEDNGAMKIDTAYSFFPIEEVNAWIKQSGE